MLLPGDPGRALRLAQALLDDPRMFNHERGLWGYTGTASDGHPLTIQSTGMGGPSAAIVVTELAEMGARQLIRVGTCGALDPALELGELLAVSAAIAADGTSRALGAGDRVEPDDTLLRALGDAARPGDDGGRLREALVASSDLFYGGGDEALRDAGADAVEMESATLFALGPRLGLETATVLIVSDIIFPRRTRIEQDSLIEAELRAGELAARALSVAPGEPNPSEATVNGPSAATP